MARESQVVEGIEVNKLAAPQVIGKLIEALALKRMKAVDALVENGLATKTVLKEVGEKLPEWQKLLKPYIEKALDRGVALGAGKQKVKIGETKDYKINNYNKKLNKPISPSVVVPLHTFKGSDEVGKRVEVLFEEDKIIITMAD
jgi:hypothetical protein